MNYAQIQFPKSRKWITPAIFADCNCWTTFYQLCPADNYIKSSGSFWHSCLGAFRYDSWDSYVEFIQGSLSLSKRCTAVFLVFSVLLPMRLILLKLYVGRLCIVNCCSPTAHPLLLGSSTSSRNRRILALNCT